MLDFDNLTELKTLKMREKCPPLPLYHLQMLTSLEDIEIRRCASCKELTQLLSYFPKLTKLRIHDCREITGLGVLEQRTMAQTGQQQREIRGGDETAAEGLLLLPPQIQVLWIDGSPELSLRADSLDDDTAGGGLQGLHSLRSLKIQGCPKFLSSSSGFPMPTSLQDLTLFGVEGMATLAPLSNLTSLTKLSICECGDLSGEDLWPLLTHGHLIELRVTRTPKFFIGSEPSRPHEQELLCHSSKLQKLETDDVAGVLAAPVCGILSSSLTSLEFSDNEEVDRFTEEQEKALHLLPSLQDLVFDLFPNLQCLPAGLHRLTNLEKLQILDSPAIRSLPKDGLPSSLQMLDVYYSGSEELIRQCLKLTGTIPIIRA